MYLVDSELSNGEDIQWYFLHTYPSMWCKIWQTTLPVSLYQELDHWFLSWLPGVYPVICDQISSTFPSSIFSVGYYDFVKTPFRNLIPALSAVQLLELTGSPKQQFFVCSSTSKDGISELSLKPGLLSLLCATHDLSPEVGQSDWCARYFTGVNHTS